MRSISAALVFVLSGLAVATVAAGQKPAAKPAPPAEASAPKQVTVKPAPAKKGWVVLRTADGKPDLQGNWTNETQTPLERMGGGGSTLTDEQAAKIEQRALLVEEYRDKASDPNRGLPPKGGEQGKLAPPGERSFIEQIAEAAGGGVGGYNGFWLDPGLKVIRIDGVARSSIIIDPPNGRIPGLTDAAKKRLAEAAKSRPRVGEFDHPEARPLSDRCILSFGSNAGPPMLPNYFYNNNYTIVQSKDHVMILTEMNHDARIVRLGAKQHLPKSVRPYFGDSIGWWEGDTLVVETTNIHPTQLNQPSILWAYRGASENLKVTERFTRTGPDTIIYRFTMEDPDTFTAPFTGELPFTRLDEMIYEYACHEGNYAMTNILQGERAKERREAEQKKQQ
jgi:hypothetical protein